ncbi:MAG: PAS domain S-box protein [Gammaproteobacteria bacterium]|nr:PAS domain S-box protein [Gammaproteobacteria bacterium]
MLTTIGSAERKTNEALLAASEADFRALVESANDIIYTVGPDATLTYVSPTWKDILGHEPSDVMGKTFDHFIYAEDVPRCFEFMDKLIAARQKQSGLEYRIRDIHGNLQWHTTNASPIFDEHGNIKKFMGIAREITDQKVQQEQMQPR